MCRADDHGQPVDDVDRRAFIREFQHHMWRLHRDINDALDLIDEIRCRDESTLWKLLADETLELGDIVAIWSQMEPELRGAIITADKRSRDDL